VEKVKGKKKNAGSRKKFYAVMAACMAVFIISAAVLTIRSIHSGGEEGPSSPTGWGSVSGTGEPDAKSESLGGRKEDFHLFLLCGTDQSGARTDTIMLAALDGKGKAVNILQIPRDTMLDVERQDKKVNASYAYGKYDLLKKDLQNYFGVPIDGYVLVNTKGFRNIVDLMGGVEVTVPFNMDYEDPEQDLYIHLKAGKQILNGSKAEQYVRFRKGYVDQDLGRMRAQKAFLSAAIKKMLTPSTIIK